MTPREPAAVALHPATATVVAFGPFRFDRGNGLLARVQPGSPRQELPLPPRAVAVLSVLVERAGRVVGKDELLQAAWNGAFVTETSLTEAVSLLRQTLEDDSQRPVYIQTVHRRGYRFIAPLRLEEATGERAPTLRESWPVPLPAPASDHTGPASLPAPTPSTHRRPTLALALAGLVGLLVGAGAALAPRLLEPSRRPARVAPTRFAISPPAGQELPAYYPGLAVSPDGRQVVYGTEHDDELVLVRRDLGSFASVPIAGTRNAAGPFFSPDSRTLGFFANGQLLRVPLAGGTPVPVTAIPGEELGGSWAEDGTIVFAAGGPTSLYRIAAAGGTPRRLTRPDPARGEVAHWWPQVLPGGRSVIFTVWSTTLYDARIDWLSLVTGERRTLARGGAGAIYAAGKLLWAGPTGGVVMAPLDVTRGTLTGPPTPLLVDALTHPFYGFMQLAAGGDTLAYLPASAQVGERRLLAFDGGAERALPTPRRFYRNLKAGPGGQLAATILDRDRSDLWLVDAHSGALTRFTFDGFNIEPAWSADGRWLAYASNRDGAFNIYRRRTDGSAPPERLLRSDHHQHPSSFSPDGRELLIGEIDPETGFDLWVLDLASRQRRPLLRTRAQEIYAVWSPDGRWLAYATDESGRWEVVVRSYPDFAGRWQVSDGGGFEPFWAADGRTLYFRRGSSIWALPVAPAGRELHPGAATKVLERKGLTLAAPSPGGGLVAIVDERARPQPAELRVMVGWIGGLLPPP